MDGPTTGVAVFAFLCSSAMAGVMAHARLPGSLFTARTASVLRGSIGVITLMAGLMLVLLTISLKNNFDAAARDVSQFAAEVTDLDHTLRQAGPAADPARSLLFRYTARTMKDIWPATTPTLGPEDAQAKRLFHELEDSVGHMRSADPQMGEIESHARQDLQSVMHARWNMESRSGRTLSPWMVVVLVFWLMLFFASLGLSVPRSPLVMAILGLGALALAGAVFLIVEYSDPYEGIIVVPCDPIENALFALSE